MNIEEMLDEIEIGGMTYKKAELKEELEKQIKEAEKKGWNDITVEIEILKKCLNLR